MVWRRMASAVWLEVLLEARHGNEFEALHGNQLKELLSLWSETAEPESHLALLPHKVLLLLQLLLPLALGHKVLLLRVRRYHHLLAILLAQQAHLATLLAVHIDFRSHLV